MDQLIATQQEHKVTEEQRIKKAVAEQDAKQAQQQWEEEERKAAMLKSITAYRESLVTQMLPRPTYRKMRSHFKVFLVVCVGTYTLCFYQRQEKEQRDKMAKQNNRDTLEARKEADRIFLEKQQMKSQQIKEDGRQVQVFNIRQMVKWKHKNKHSWFGGSYAPRSLKQKNLHDVYLFVVRRRKVPGASS